MKRHHFLTLLLASFFIVVAFHGVSVYASISGDEICGGVTECSINDVTKIFKGIFNVIISLGLPILVVFIMYRLVIMWYSLRQGNANAIKEAGYKVGQAIFGFVIIVALFGGIFLTMLKYLGVKDFPLKLLQIISSEVVPHVYAAPIPKNACPPKPQGHPCMTNDDKSGFCVGPSQCEALNTANGIQVPKGNCGGNYGTGISCLTDDNQSGACYTSYCVKLLPELAPTTPAQTTPSQPSAPATTQTPVSTQTQLPNPLGVTSLYDFILSVLNLVMRFFIYPALIAMWVWSGFSYVLAQGAPDKIAKTHKLLLWAFISTLLVFITQGFLVAVRGSVQKIVPSSSMIVPVSTFDVVSTSYNLPATT